MSRSRFGGDVAAWLVEVATDPDVYSGATAVILPTADTVVNLFVDASGATPATDLLDATGSAITSITVPAGTSYLPAFFGPDNDDDDDQVTSLYFEAEDGTFVALLPTDLGSRTATVEGEIDSLDGRVSNLEHGSGGGGAGFNVVYQETSGIGGWPARPDTTTYTYWVGVDFPPVGVVSGATYALPGDDFKRATQLVDVTP